MLFSCSNNTQEVRDFLVSKNLPIGVAKDAFHVYKDSGRITSKLITPLLRILVIENNILIMSFRKE